MQLRHPKTQIVNTSIAGINSMTPELMPPPPKSRHKSSCRTNTYRPFYTRISKGNYIVYCRTYYRRDEVRDDSAKNIQFLNESTERKIRFIIIANVAITDFDFSTEFNRAIEEKVREQEALKATNEKDRRVTSRSTSRGATLIADALLMKLKLPVAEQKQ